MPTMLGLTNDPSPHGMQAQQHQQQYRQQQRNGNSNMELTARGSGAITGGASKSKSPAPSGSSGSKDGGKKIRKDTIFGRNHAAAIEAETLLWRALCDDPASALEYIAADGAVVNPFLFGDAGVRSSDSETTLEDGLKEAEPYLSYRMHDPTVVEIDLMAVAILYRITLFRHVEDGKGEGSGRLETVEATGGSSWRQTAGGDWRLATMHVAPA